MDTLNFQPDDASTIPLADVSDDAASQLDDLAEEFSQRLRSGRRPSIEEFAERYPVYAGEIRQLFPALAMMEKVQSDGESQGIWGALPESAQAKPAIERLGDFRILREVGRGGMGVVYEAIEESLGRHVALKVFPIQGRNDSRQVMRFQREARAAARLHHTNIVPVFGVGQCDGWHYYVMQFIHGQSLDAVIDELRVIPRVDRPPSDSSGSQRQHYLSVARIGLQAAEALAYAHGQGVLHRDIKPANLLLDSSGTIWIADFGLAKTDEADGLTRSGDLIGTLRFMAPEQFSGLADRRTDVYALGITLYELLTLRPAFEMDQRSELVRAIVEKEPRRPRACDSNIPSDLETIVLKALAKHPPDRYQQAETLAGDLRRFLENRPILARRINSAERLWRWARRNPVVAGLASIVLVLTAVLAVMMAISSAIGRERDLAVRQRSRAESAELSAEELRDRAVAAEREAQIQRHLAHSNVLRQSGAPGQRFAAMNEIKQAATLDPSDELSGQLRDAAIAAMRMTDIQLISQVDFGSEVLLQYDADLEHAATCRFDVPQPITVWNVAEQKPLVRLAGPKENYWHATATFSPDGRYLAVTYSLRDNNFERLHVWDWKNSDLVLDQPISCGNVVASVCFHPDSKSLVIPNIDHDLTIWDLGERKETRQIPFGYRPYAVRFDGKGIRLAAAAHEQSFVQVFDFESGRQLLTLSELVGRYGFNLSSDGTLLVSCDDSARCHVWNVAAGRRVFTSEDHSLTAIDAEFIPNSDLLMTQSWDGTTRIWNAKTWQRELNIPMYMIRASRDGRRFGSSKALWRLFDHDHVRTLHLDVPQDVAVPSPIISSVCRFGPSPDLDSLLIGGCRDGLRIWNWRLGQLLAKCDIGECRTVLVHPNGKSLLTVGESGVLYWPIARDGAQPTLVHIGPPQTLCEAMPLDYCKACWIDNGQRIAINDANRQQIVLMDADPHDEVNHPVQRLPSQYARITSLSASPDEKWLASGGHKEEFIQVWDVNSGQLVKTLPHSDSQDITGFYVQFSPDGKYLTSAANNATSPGFYFYDVGTWKRTKKVDAHWPPICPVVFSSDGEFAALKWTQNQVLLARASDAAELAQLQTSDRMYPNGFTANGRWLSLYNSTDVELWDLARITRSLSEIGLGWKLATPPIEAVEDDAAIELVVDVGDIGRNLVVARRAREVDQLIASARDNVDREKYPQAIAAFEKALELDSDHALAQNNFAWFLVSCPDQSYRDPNRALELANQAYRVQPGSASYLNTLGVAQYRMGQCQAAIDTLLAAEKADPDRWFSHNFFFIAMARSRLGQETAAQNDEALRDFAQASQWMKTHAPNDKELVCFRDEAIWTIFVRAFPGWLP